MMRNRMKKTTGFRSISGADQDAKGVWEMRPGGMMVQTRSELDPNRPPPPDILVRVKYGSIYHKVNISPLATFGELKKKLSELTGLHHQDQQLFFKDKERDSYAFLDVAGVKSKNKIVLMEDPLSQERRFIEMRKTANVEKAAKSISGISLEIDRLAGQVSALESIVSRGGKIEEKSFTNAIELLMNQMLKLDAISAYGDVKLQRKMQVRRVQKYVETLDVLKAKNSAADNNDNNQSDKHQQQRRKVSHEEVVLPGVEQMQARHSVGHPSAMMMQSQQSIQPSRPSSSDSVVFTTQWETFDTILTPSAAQSSASSRSTVAAVATGSPQPWDLL